MQERSEAERRAIWPCLNVATWRRERSDRAIQKICNLFNCRYLHLGLNCWHLVSSSKYFVWDSIDAFCIWDSIVASPLRVFIASCLENVIVQIERRLFTPFIHTGLDFLFKLT